MKTILFVDDEPHIIEGLKRSLRSMRQEWRMSFAGSGAEALEIMAAEPFDVIVTDMRMPGMSGAALMTETLKKYPHIVRIMLSGHADLEAIMQSVGPTHQYLSKPCDIEHLKKTIVSACGLRDLLSSHALRCMVAEMESLPSLPPLYAEMIEAVQSADSPAAAISHVIAQDMGMTAKILQLVNSAFFGLPHRMTNVAEAVGLLGLDTVRAVVLSLNVFERFDPAMLPGFSAEKLWRHSLLVGKLAREIALAEGGSRQMCEDAYTAGMLHDCGKMAMAIHLPSCYAKAMTLAAQNNISLAEAETATFGASHAEAGAYLMGLWGLPNAIVEALAFHHRPLACPNQEFGPLAAVCAANWLTRNADSENNMPDNKNDMDYSAYFAALRLTGRLTVWQEICEKMMSAEEQQ